MAKVYAPLVRQVSTTTGTGSYTVAGTVTGHAQFSARCSVGDVFRYAAREVDANGNPSGGYEIGTGTYSAANTIDRTAVLYSSNGDAPVSWTTGNRTIDIIAWSDAVLGQGFEGGVNDLAERLNTISNFASPNAGGVVSNWFYDNNPHGGVATLAGAANRMELAPYYTSVPISINQIGCAVSTAVAGSLFKILIYGTGADGWPGAKLYESADISGATAAYAFATLSFTFVPGRMYWLGVRHSSTPTLRTVAVANAFNLGLGSAGNGTTQLTVLRRTLTYATAAPDPWGFVTTDPVANVTPPSIRFRAA